MAPEQARGEPATAGADIYALGVVLFEMLVGRHPFDGDLQRVLEAKQAIDRLQLPGLLPPGLVDVVASATTRDPTLRTASASQFRRNLEPWTQPLSRVSQPIIKAGAAPTDLATVIVLAPKTSNDPRQYLLTAVHEQVLAHLSKRPRVRVLPRVTVGAGENPTFVLQFALGSMLEATITLDTGAPIKLEFPLGVEHVHASADAVTATIDAAMSRAQHEDERARQALDLFLQARHIAYRDVTRMGEAIDLLNRARELAPDDPRVASTLAIAYIRLAFFMPNLIDDALETSRVLATAAVTRAPELADGHIALGHLALTAATPVHAASHFRMAIARAPQLAEAHEQLGRMLLEAGYIDLARARLDEALAIAPDLRSAQWELSRAYALEGDWVTADKLIGEQIGLGLDRPLSRGRYAWWRGDRQTVADVRAKIGNMDRVLWPGTIDALFDIFLGTRKWEDSEPVLLATLDHDTPNLRRRVYVAQLACEAAAYSGNEKAVVHLLEQATLNGLFDLHWLDKCVLLKPFHTSPGVIAVRKRIQERAEAILDALYGDHGAALSETQIA